MSIPIVAALLLAEAVILIVALFIIYKLQAKSKANPSMATRRRDAPGWVYEFVDPDTGSTVYVGQATDVEKRVDQHLRASTSTGLFYMWIADLVQQGKRPIVRKVAYSNGKIELKRLEQEHTNKLLAEGAKFFNQRASDSSYRLARYVTIEKLNASMLNLWNCHLGHAYHLVPSLIAQLITGSIWFPSSINQGVEERERTPAKSVLPVSS